MRIKVFQATDLKEAMDMVKDEFGIDAVILHTKRYKKGGFLGYGSKEVVEVTAAIDDVAPKKPKITTKAGDFEHRLSNKARSVPQDETLKRVARPKNMVNQYTMHTNNTLKTPDDLTPPRDLSNKEELFANHLRPKQAPILKDFADLNQMSIQQGASEVPRKMPSQRVAPPRVDLRADGAVAEEKFVALKPETLSKKGADSQEKIRALENELAQMKEILSQVIVQKEDVKEKKNLKDILLEQEIAEEIVQDLIRNSPAGTIFLEKDNPNAKEALKNYFQMAIKMTEGINVKKGKQKIVALIGPTGIGKTTTLAKIAAKFVLEKGVSSVLITADTYRISAVEQLKTYSDIIGLPLEIVYSPRELETAIKKHAQKELILIDTAGRSQHNDYQMQELQELLAVNSKIEKHLVMSATTKEKDAFDIFENFSSCKPDRILFTKTDETRSLGLLVNLLFKKKMTLSYLTNGQSVPDDIIPATSEALAELVLR